MADRSPHDQDDVSPRSPTPEANRTAARLFEPTGRRARRRTQSSEFGVAGREGHDASGFYRGFEPPEISGDDEVRPCTVVDRLVCADSADMAAVTSNSVALVVTSPPYHAAKQYETGDDTSAPATYAGYLAMLEAVFAECHRVLEPGGRICVNVANLGRRPYRPLSADVWAILERLGFLGRGEIVWVKGRGASGSAAFGSYVKASNPVLRDVTERILIASKGRFDRARPWKERQAQGLPWESTITPADFLAWTLDVWEIRPESARRVGHPAPFPVELPRRLIELYTYRDDVILDCFVGAGTTAVAAVLAGRHYLGYDLDRHHLAIAERRIAAARASVDGRLALGEPASGRGSL